MLEIAGEGLGNYEVGTVYSLRVDPLDWPLGSLAYSDAGGFCALEV